MASAPILVSRETASAEGRAQAIADVLALRVFDLAELPVKCTLCLRVDPIEQLAHLTTSRDFAAEMQQLGWIVLTPNEYEALTVALADGRCTREDALQELRRKLSNARHRLTLAGLLQNVAHPDRAGERWTVGDLARALGAEIADVRFEDAPNAAQEGIEP